jgi:hypothetical protein
MGRPRVLTGSCGLIGSEVCLHFTRQATRCLVSTTISAPCSLVRKVILPGRCGDWSRPSPDTSITKSIIATGKASFVWSKANGRRLLCLPRLSRRRIARGHRRGTGTVDRHLSCGGSEPEGDALMTTEISRGALARLEARLLPPSESRSPSSTSSQRRARLSALKSSNCRQIDDRSGRWNRYLVRFCLRARLRPCSSDTQRRTPSRNHQCG